MAEIYGLYDPDGGSLRYIGKAVSSVKRLKSHISDSRRGKRPVCLWIKGLTSQGKIPLVKVIEVIPDSEWKAAEKRIIAQHSSENLLNLAPGGDQPSCSAEQRSAAGYKLNATLAKNPQMAAVWRAKRDMARLYSHFRKKPDVHAYTLRLFMKCYAAEKPHWYADWASL